ncbi:hypothetical protein EYW49_20475 [Siculibacillus lacustris]|uniref:Uncharacterized protein n=1 Tax=Siculibacillus lacustris TaxID=1549641 RepID=A0A4V2KSL3_9HYPH|nr:hypothetical protein [Siculibacillus lacustris]TBW33337.1 hypothetical protein EYW49_20475 [Siculibacillus lacustris]
MADAAPTVSSLLREAHAAALAAGYEDPLWGTAVILAVALAELSDRMPEFRRTTSRDAPE